MKRARILLVYPPLGMSGNFVRHAPISLLYAASLVVKAGYEVEIFDARLHGAGWREKMATRVTPEVLLTGVSVMSGSPVCSAREVAAVVKRKDPAVKVVWGGPFAMFNPEKILDQDSNSDYVVSGYGAKPLLALVESLAAGREPDPIPGLYGRDHAGQSYGVPADWQTHEIIHYHDIPYHLISDYGQYGQLDSKRMTFSIYSAMGCPYRCGFCSSPALYKNIKGSRWQPLSVEEIVNHIQFLIDKYKADFIYFIDDDSFVELGHVESIIDLINERGIKVKLGFRGARINEIKKMSHAFLNKLAAAGTDILHIGAESGSDRLLKLVRKNCTVQDILECNQKLAKHQGIFAFYNFIVGLPTETLDDMRMTSNLMLRLIDENPNCIISTPNLFRPLPGTELHTLAKDRWSFESPESLDDWGLMEVETQYDLPWVSNESKKYFSMMLLASYFIDDKINKMQTGNSMLMIVSKIANAVYRPIAKLRMKHGYAHFLIERWLYDAFKRLLNRINRCSI